jgi:hypothetical protein
VQSTSGRLLLFLRIASIAACTACAWLFLTAIVAASPPQHHPAPHYRQPATHWWRPASTHCWRWDGARWAWVPVIELRSSDLVWIDGNAYTLIAPAPGAGFSFSLRIGR